MKTIVLIGRTGYVGSRYLQYFKEKNISHISIPERKAVSGDYVAYINDFLKDTGPCFVLNAAGYTGKPNVDACEDHKDECVEGNVIFPYRLAKICAENNCVLGHVSSGCIYTGSKNGKGFTEEDEPNFTFKQNNCSFYSGTKAKGETALKDFEKVYIWRLRIPFDNINNPRNYLSKLMTYNTLLEADNSISDLNEFVLATTKMFEIEAPYGIYNVTNTNHISTSGVVELLRKYKLPNDQHVYKFFEDEKQFMKTAAKAPRSNCIMDNSKLLNCGIFMSDAYEAVERNLSTWIE